MSNLIPLILNLNLWNNLQYGTITMGKIKKKILRNRPLKDEVLNIDMQLNDLAKH